MKSIYKNININLLLLMLVFGVQGLPAQTDIVLNDVVLGKADVSASNSITLSPGFNAKAGSSFHAYISADATNNPTNPTLGSASDVSVNGTPSAGKNYVHTIVFPGTDLKSEQVNYFDGLGRAQQSVSVAASPTGKDLVKHVYYDDLGRESRKYLPYVADTDDGSFKTSAQTEVENYYKKSIKGKEAIDNYPYAETVFEESPLNRVLSMVGAGEDWHGDTKDNWKAVKYDYLTNSNAVSSWDENGNSKNYETSTLYVAQVTDENGNITREYKDLLGQVILKESVTDTENLKTYYIYDDYGLLRTVVPPLANGPGDKELCYFYTYDERKRMISKKLPGAESVYMVYDKRDRLVLTQDGNMRNESTTAANKYMFTRYDEYNRPVMTGELVTSNSLETIRTLFQEDDNYVPYEEYTGSGEYGYTSQSYPTGIIITSKEIETVNWYDNYTFITDLGNIPASDFAYDPPTGFEPAETDNATGLVTGTMVKAFGISGSGYSMVTNKMYSVSYYDDYGNVIQTISQNHMGGRDVVSFRYQDVTQQLLQTQQQHILDGSVQLTITETYDYDHAGRLLETTHQVNDQDPIILNAMRYNELGELVEKYLHAKKGSNAFVQKVDFQYNIRGWLTQINNPVLEDNDLFGMKLFYNDASTITGVTAENQFNGNIATMQWNTKNDKIRGYGFQYDALNRLTHANYGEGASLSENQDLFSMSADYDKNGNINWLHRNFEGNIADKLEYNYFEGTNKLKKVNDPIGDATGIEDYVANSPNNYAYDDNGNMTFDAGKNANVDYNPLNLPQTITDNSDPNVKIFYHYDAAGRKLAKTNESGNASVDNTTDYVGNIVYENNEIAYIQTSEGRMIPIKDENETKWHYEYALKDHLGNTRVTFGGSILGGSVDIIQQSHYYPFGLVLKQENYQNSLTDYTKNKYLYNGKELQDDQLASGSSLNWYDYGWRMQDPALGRWHAIDNLAENSISYSPYVYCINNPIAIIDPDGDDWFYYSKNGKSDATWNWHDGDTYEHNYKYKDENGEEQTESISLQGVNAVVEFNGAYDEKLGEDGTLTGDGANPASVTVYGPGGKDDVQTYRGLTVSSDPAKYPMLENGTYTAEYQELATSPLGQNSKEYRITGSTTNTAGYPTGPMWFNSANLSPVGGWKFRDIKNKDYAHMTQIFIHRTNWSGNATLSSQGCLLIDGQQYNSFQNQLGTLSKFMVIVKRPYIPFTQRSAVTGIKAD